MVESKTFKIDPSLIAVFLDAIASLDLGMEVRIISLLFHP